MKALILNGKVVQLSEATFEVHPSMSWVDATEAAEVGSTWDGSNFGSSDTRTVEQKAAEALAQLRSDRNKRLANTDWWVLPDRTATAEQLAYRQALRDITNTYSSLDDVVWPTKPE